MTRGLSLVLTIALTIVLGLGGILACRGDADRRSDEPRGDSSPKAQPASSAGVQLDAAARRRAGIETQALKTGTGADVVRLPGTLVADPTRVTTIQSPLSGRLTIGPGAQWPGYGERVPGGAVLGQVSDARPLTAGRGGTVTKVSAQPGELVQAGQVLLELTDFGEPMARVIWRATAPTPAPPTVQIAPLTAVSGGRTSGTSWITAHLVGPAADADSLTHLPMYLYRAPRGWPGAAPGTPVVVVIDAGGAPARGLFVPAAAVVQWEGLAWVYVEEEAEAAPSDTAGHAVPAPSSPIGSVVFVRHRVDTRHPVDGGWLVSSESGDNGLSRGDAVVVRGAQQLLSEEFKTRAITGDEDEP
jgi:biotin carboxyl carrier protein